jgi:hypothetical protein
MGVFRQPLLNCTHHILWSNLPSLLHFQALLHQ